MEEPGNPTTLVPFVEDNVLIDTGNNIKTTQEGPRNEEDFFLVSHSQDEQYFGQNVVETEQQTEEALAWTHLCRICANPKNQLIPIFEDVGLEYDLSSKILKYLPIHVSKDDTLPSQVCYQCTSILLSWHELIEGCLNAEKKLLEIQNMLQNKHEYHKSISAENEVGISASIAATTATLIPGMDTLQPDQQEKNDNKNEMHIDVEEDTNKSTRWTHVPNDELTTHAPDNWQTKSDTEKCVDIEKTRSKIFNKKCLSSIKSDRSDTFNKELKNMRRNCSRVTESNGCTVYKCKECGKILSTSYNLLIHHNIHTGARPYTCHVCDKSFRSASGLNRHVRDVHDGVKNFACDVCDRRFASRTSRDEHRQTHTDERPHVCEICGKSFKQKASLHVHRLYHSQILPHCCNFCGRGFHRKQELEKHVSWHSDQKPYTCDICDRQFRSKSCVTRHRGIHTNRRSYICTACSAGFTQKRYLKRHCENLHKTSAYIQA
ncbi:zinc finger protein 701-like isoform X3 [Pseudomyrmex gracilis]|uniref:zinc finger protein 701-like isoform X3 n=1 Tax=Pseudomyrmex gracilis TaxID=219809 RepID=UPI0009959E9A|nr:zinc finger protein 701-like isoform X3 [Pseudomyrmex gracilis]